MKKLKKALSLTLALALSLAMAVPAFAAQIRVNTPYSMASVYLSEGTAEGAVKVKRSNNSTVTIPLYTVPVNTILEVTATYVFLDKYALNSEGIYESVDEQGHRYENVSDFQIPLDEEYAGFVWYVSVYTVSGDGFLVKVDGNSTPVEPEQPTEPTTPVEPEQPTEPTTPVEPEQPTEPTTPVEPEQPTTPAEGAADYVVSASNNQRLNVRKGPGINYGYAAPALKNGTVIQIVETQGDWGKLANDAGWVYLPATTPVAEPAKPAEPETPAQPAGPELAEGEVAYTIKPGDSLSKIAKDVYGDVSAYKQIAERNPDVIKDVNKIYAGQVIVLPVKE